MNGHTGGAKVISDEKDRLLANLAKIEMGLSKIYEHLAQRKDFRKPVKEFWNTMKNEEIGHAYVFERIRERAKTDKSFDIDINIPLQDLKQFVDKVNALLKKVKNETISETEAYSFGAIIEAELDEASFLRKIATNDPAISESISELIHDTKKHNLVLVNYSRGVR